MVFGYLDPQGQVFQEPLHSHKPQKGIFKEHCRMASPLCDAFSNSTFASGSAAKNYHRLQVDLQYH